MNLKIIREKERRGGIAILMNIRSYMGLVESTFSSMKAFFDEIESKLDKTRKIGILVLGLADNVAKLVTRGKI